jgi:hypothetical protein
MAAIYSNGGNRWNILGFSFTKRDALSNLYKISMGACQCAEHRSCMRGKLLYHLAYIIVHAIVQYVDANAFPLFLRLQESICKCKNKTTLSLYLGVELRHYRSAHSFLGNEPKTCQLS